MPECPPKPKCLPKCPPKPPVCPPKPPVCCPPMPPVCCPPICCPPSKPVIQDCGTKRSLVPPIPKITVGGSYQDTAPQPPEAPTPASSGDGNRRYSFEEARGLLQPGYSRFDETDPKQKGLGKRISSNTLHGIDSVNDLRSWGISGENRRRHFLEQMNRSREDRGFVDEDYPANEPGADGLTGFVEVDDPVEVLGPFAGDQPSPSAPPMPGSTPTNGGQGGGGNAGPVAPGAGGSSPSPSYGALDRTFSDVPGSSDPAEAEMLERTNDPAMGRSMHGPSTADPGAQNISGTGTASTSQNMLNPSQRAPLPSGKMHPAAERAANGMSRTDMPNIPGMVFGPNDRMASSNDPTSTRAQLPHGSLSQSALPNQPPKKTSPCIPSDCVQANLLEQIEALKEKNHRLAAQLEMSQSFLEKQQEMLAAATIAKAQQPAPNVAVSPPQLQEAAASVTPPPKAQPVAPAPPSPPGPPSPPPPFFAAPPATECVPTTPEQEVLLKQVQQLRQERDELERRLNQGQGETDAGRTETERQIKEASTLVSRLEREKSGLEAKLRSLQANNDFRGRQLEDFMHMMESQRNNLKCEISRRTKELETEIMKKNALQTKFQESMRSLEQQKQVDLQTRLENERLKSNLERLQSQLGSQFRPSSANNPASPGMRQPMAFGNPMAQPPPNPKEQVVSCAMPPAAQDRMRLSYLTPAPPAPRRRGREIGPVKFNGFDY